MDIKSKNSRSNPAVFFGLITRATGFWLWRGENGDFREPERSVLLHNPLIAAD